MILKKLIIKSCLFNHAAEGGYVIYKARQFTRELFVNEYMIYVNVGPVESGTFVCGPSE